MIISFYNSKGGVAKTTNTVHIGAALAKKGKSVLLIDFDPQMDLTTACGIENASYTVKNLLEGTGKISLRKKSENFNVLAGDSRIHANTLTHDSLKKVIEPWKEGFDYILIDCPPAPMVEHALTIPEVALNASDYFFIPITPDLFPVNNATKVLSKVVEVIKPRNKTIKFGGFFFSMVLITATRKNAIFFNKMEEQAPGFVFKNFIRKDIQIGYATDSGKTIFQFKPNCNAGNDFIKLTKELVKRTSNGKK